ncbi:ABC transporter permease [Alloalcanivorax mobilis]|uniref:ABC transporter permease n=1 Tax=Alloalcanivorax mobilis TaxID=2019569 RepID=UPI000C7570EF|nr:ABC transporter permease [Alloalcanivorax mobilis]
MNNNPSLQTDNEDRAAPEEAFQWAWGAMSAHHWEQAARRWATLRVVYSDHAPVWIQAGVSLRHLGRYDQAATLLREARHRFPDRPGGWIDGAEVELERSDHEEADRLLHEARIRFRDEPPVWLRSADLAWARGDVDTALRYNQHARDSFPDKPGGYVQYAEFAMAGGDWEAAGERWTRVRERFPALPMGYRRAAEAEERLGRHRAARRLRLAEEYGMDWLSELEDTEREVTAPVMPPRRRDWRSFVDLVWTKARLNLKSEANRNHLRYMWWVIDPLLYMLVFYIVFGMLMQRGGEGYVAYLLTGLVPFQWFAKTIQHTSNSIIQGKGLMHQVRISPLFFPLVGIVQNTGKQLLVFLMLGLFLVFYGLPPTLHWVAILPVVLLQLLLMVVVSCAVAMLAPFVRDIINLVPTGIQFTMFVSGIFYTLDRIPEQWRSLFFLNPVANILHQYRLILVENQWPDWSSMWWVTLGCLLALAVIVLLYRRLESIFPRVVIE